MTQVTDKTRILGVFGDPIGHSLSPAIQNAAFETLDIDMLYLPFHITPDGLAQAVSDIRTREMPGVNITIPHKVEVMSHLDIITEEASAIGAVNTVTNNNGILSGYNTDGRGYLRSLSEEAGFSCKGKHVVVIGAGGAARGILYAILKEGPASVTVTNRTAERGEKLAAEFQRFRGEAGLTTVPFEKDTLKPRITKADLIVNTTSLGMSGKVAMNTMVLSLETLKPDAVVSDIVYKPYNTVLLRNAKEAGVRVHHGLGMLIFQGALGFELWTGKEAPIEIMRKAALAALEISPR